jgi:flagellar biosynthesis protein FlhB
LPKQNLSSALKALVLLPFIGFVLYEEIGQKLPDLANLAAQPLGPALIQSEDMMASLFRRLVIALLVIGIVDYVRQKQKFQKELRMSKQEIKDESKEAQGDPQIKMRIRRLQRDAMRRSMMKNIPKATAVIVNPTHYAIAIQYEMHSKAVPLVVAKGRNYLALAIKQKAIEHEIPIVENKPLAQALYQAVDVGQEIPSHLYKAVAEVLAYVYRTINRR